MGEYLHHKYFDNSPLVSFHQSSTFWTWLGPVACALRFKRHINTLWFHGLIYGLISKRDCEILLGQQRVGTFVIRFSESYPGFFAVSYVTHKEILLCIIWLIIRTLDHKKLSLIF